MQMNNRAGVSKMQGQQRKSVGLYQPHSFRGLILCTLLLSLAAALYAQQNSPPPASETNLPNAPGHEFNSPRPQGPESTASISGTVLDINEGIVSGAKVTLETQSGLAERVETSDSAGLFSFKNLPAGIFKIRITAANLGAFESYEFTLHPGDRYHLPKIALPIATAGVDITVTATENELAVEQVQGQLQQRVFGIFPNFYTSFIWNAAPLKPRPSSSSHSVPRRIP